MSQSDPLRLADSASDAPDELRELFRAGARDLPSQTELARLSSKLGPLLGPSAGPATGGTTPASGGSAATIGKLGALAAALIGGAVIVTSLNQEVPSNVPEPRPAPVAAPAAKPEEAPRAPSVAAAPNFAPETPSAEPSTEPRPAARSERRSSAELEVELLERARAALKNNPQYALSLTAEHKLRFPGGALAQEREVIAIEALKRLGREDQASLRSDEFSKNYPGSAHRRKLDAGVTR
jgi:hypothetical protein